MTAMKRSFTLSRMKELGNSHAPPGEASLRFVVCCGLQSATAEIHRPPKNTADSG